jgi:hypothetical protein
VATHYASPPYICNILQHTTTLPRSIDQAVHYTASTGTRCAAILSPVASAKREPTDDPLWLVRTVLRSHHGKTTPEEIYNADTLLMYSSRVWACLAVVAGTTFAVLSFSSSSVEGCLQVIEQTLHRCRAVSRDSLYALVPSRLVV